MAKKAAAVSSASTVSQAAKQLTQQSKPAADHVTSSNQLTTITKRQAAAELRSEGRDPQRNQHTYHWTQWDKKNEGPKTDYLQHISSSMLCIVLYR